MGLLDANRRFLINMGYPYVPMFIQIGITTSHIFWCYLFTDVFDLGIKGTALASSLSNLLNLAAFTIYTTYFTKGRMREEAWFSPFAKNSIRECFDARGLKDYMKFGVSSIGMQSLEWWSYEMMMVFSAYLGV